jgi:predicted nucleic acid-binding protein
MSERTVVTNTSPMLALTAATGSLVVLNQIFERVIAPFEVVTETQG